MIDLAVNLLQIHYYNEFNKLKKLGIDEDIRTYYVFTNNKGQRLGSKTFYKFWKKFCETHDLRFVPPYGLRRTTATMLAYNDIPLANIAEQMEHLDSQQP